MKNYLLLSNGISLEVISNRSAQNTIGKVKISNEFGKIDLLPAKIFGSSQFADEPMELELDSDNFSKIKNLISKDDSISGKFISDSLGIDYHLYDLKNSILY